MTTAVKNDYSIVWSRLLGILAIHIGGIIGLWYAYEYASWTISVMAIILYFPYHISISIGAHRYFTHLAYRLKLPAAMTIAILFTGTSLGKIKTFRKDHLKHHAREDRPGEDPHTPRDGLGHSHMFWLFKEFDKSESETDFTKGKSDEVSQYVMDWQEKNYWWLSPVMVYGVPTFIGFLLGDWLGGLLIIGFLRLVFQMHMTWTTNSAGHTYGERIGDGLATNIGYGPCAFILCLVGAGEPNHGWHHISPRYWRLSREGDVWFRIDPGAWVLIAMKQFGWAYDFTKISGRERKLFAL